MFCEELFKGIEEKKGGESTYEVKFSMLEIYNEIAPTFDMNNVWAMCLHTSNTTCNFS